MKTQNRPELKVGDRVRFRSDGEIGELNRSQNLNTEIFHTVKKICKDGRVYHEGGGAYAQVQFDICNDLSDIQVGDKVERYSKYGITTDTVVSVSENEFKLEICEKLGCNLSISKADGIHGNFPDGGWYVLRIVEKAKPVYKAGDFIKDGGNYYIVTSPTTCVGLLNGKGYEICPKTSKIVSPSEEVLDFGNGIKGTVRSCEYDSGYVRVISGDRVVAHIVTDILEQPMRELVERLLIAQEEK